MEKGHDIAVICFWLCITFGNSAWCHFEVKLCCYPKQSLPLNYLLWLQFSSVLSLSRVWLFVTPWQHARPPCPSPSPGVHSNTCPSSLVMPSSPLILCRPFSSCPQSLRVFFQRVNSLHEVDKVSEFQLQYQSFQWTPRTDWSPRDSQESSPTPQLKSIDSLAIFKILFWMLSKLL